MYPIRLNLLSPQKKHHLKRMALFIFFKNILEVTLVVVIVAAIVLVSGRWFLQNYFNELTEKLVMDGNQHTGMNTRIKEVNRVLKDIALTQKEYVAWSSVLEGITETVPATITMESMVLDRVSGIYTFTGIATTRNDLLLFQKNLQALPFIAKVDVPLSQLTEKEDIPFIITAAYKQ